VARPSGPEHERAEPEARASPSRGSAFDCSRFEPTLDGIRAQAGFGRPQDHQLLNAARDLMDDDAGCSGFSDASLADFFTGANSALRANF